MGSWARRRHLLASLGTGATCTLSGVDCFSSLPVNHLAPRSASLRRCSRSTCRLSGGEPDLSGGSAELLTRSEAILRTLAYPLIFAAAFRIGAVLSVIGQPRLPQHLPGPYNSIGSRVVRLPVEVGGARVRLFYPCEEEPFGEDAEFALYCTDGRATSDGMAGLVGFKQLGLSFLLAHLADASSGCLLDAAPIQIRNESSLQSSPEPLRMPLLVYSHGYGGNMDMATYFLRAVASTGMVVAAVEHTDGTASATRLADGTQLPFAPNIFSGKEQLQRRSTELLAAAEPANLPSDISLLIDETSVFLEGHSYGAPAALLAAANRAENSSRKGSLIAGLILHDPALGMGAGMLNGKDAALSTIPTVSYTSDEYNNAGVRCGDLTLHVRGAFHGNFVDAPLWAPSWVMRPLSTIIPAAGPADPVRVHSELAKSAAAFARSREAVFGPSTGTYEDGLFELV